MDDVFSHPRNRIATLEVSVYLAEIRGGVNKTGQKFLPFLANILVHRIVVVGSDLLRSSQPSPCSRRATYSRFSSTMSRQLLNISSDEGTITSLDSLFLVLDTYTVEFFFLFLFSKRMSCIFASAHCLLLPLWALLRKVWFPLQLNLMFTHIDKIPLSPILQAEQPPLL